MYKTMSFNEWFHVTIMDKAKLMQFLDFSLGDFVKHPDKPEWGIGQVQSITGMRVIVNFEDAGKMFINCELVELLTVADETD